ncbi:MAG: DUF4238 domain-containing protein [Planctomycetia bacterium]|nr:DUF4238 domain-containing protein [Planctomycetia bacterium]
MDKSPKKQHYLAQFYLKGFCSDYNTSIKQISKNSNRLWYYDLKRKEYRNQHIRKIASQNYFYSWTDEMGKKDYSIEKELGEFENQISPLIKEINDITVLLQKHRKITHNVTINSNQRIWLLEFLRMMIVRVPSLINTIKNAFVNDMENNFPELFDSKDSSFKKDVLKTVLNIGSKKNKFLDVWFNREIWIVFPSSNKASFITSDRPVWRFNKNGPNGIAYDDTEVYLPLTQNCLLMVTSQETDTSLLRFTSINDKSLIREFNKRQASYATEIVLGRDEDLLRSLLKSIKFMPPPTRKDGHLIL